MASFLYHSLLSDMASGAINFETDSFKVMLVTSAYAADASARQTVQAAHNRRDDITNEISGTGYTAGGYVADVSFSRTGGTLSITIPGNLYPAPFSATQPKYGILYKNRGGASSADELCVCLDISTAAPNGGSYEIQISGTVDLTIPQAT